MVLFYIEMLQNPRTRILIMNVVESSNLTHSMMIAYKNKLQWQ